ncbi:MULTISPECIES: acyl carrier protein [Streptomyces]|uniref:ACP protein n=3 Tax=Streptomyces TaxID=1883 RepID=D7BSM6_STRBB|nr:MULTISPECIES: acyl carrier protein [Streptomyces]AAP42869.1 NanA10 [Streptomyces nanchangensis]ADI11523.1 ACP protein [Streptomyces bingchenggensis BCW-1]
MEPNEEATHDEQLVARLASATPEERQRLLAAQVLRRASEVLDVPALDEESNFLENGLSSLSAVQLAKSLMSDTGLEVPLVAIVEHPTSTLLGKYLAETYEADAA